MDTRRNENGRLDNFIGKRYESKQREAKRSFYCMEWCEVMWEIILKKELPFGSSFL